VLLYGADVARMVFRAHAPRDPLVLERFATEVVQRLQRVALPPSRVDDMKLSIEVASRRIESAHQALATKLHVTSSSLTSSNAWLKRDHAIERYDRVFRGIALTLTGLCTLAGDEELAEDLCPASQPGQVTTSTPTSAAV
jgi:hypothetical protein